MFHKSNTEPECTCNSNLYVQCNKKKALPYSGAILYNQLPSQIRKASNTVKPSKPWYTNIYFLLSFIFFILHFIVKYPALISRLEPVAKMTQVAKLASVVLSYQSQ